MKTLIFRAGLIPYYIEDDGTVSMLFMIPSDPKMGGSSPQIAKGQIEEGELAKETAIREAKEELGLLEGNINGDVHHIGRFLGRTDFYTCRVKSKSLFGIPHYETGETVWLTMNGFRQHGRELHIPVVEEIYHFIVN